MTIKRKTATGKQQFFLAREAKNKKFPIFR